MCECFVCKRIAKTKCGENPFFVRELETGYVVIGDFQRFKGYTLFLCKFCASELHFLPADIRDQFLHEMAIVAEAVYRAFKPDKLNYELLGAGNGIHMHWHFFPRRTGDTPTPGPVWQLGADMYKDEFRPTSEELDQLKQTLAYELDRLLLQEQK